MSFVLITTEFGRKEFFDSDNYVKVPEIDHEQHKSLHNLLRLLPHGTACQLYFAVPKTGKPFQITNT